MFSSFLAGDCRMSMHNHCVSILIKVILIDYCYTNKFHYHTTLSYRYFLYHTSIFNYTFQKPISHLSNNTSIPIKFTPIFTPFSRILLLN